MNHLYDCIVIGAGPAGMTAAIYMSRAGHSVLVMEQLAPGGQAALTYHIENYPGYENGIGGVDLTMKMQQQTERFGATFEYEGVVSFEQDPETAVYKVVSVTGKEFFSKTVLITTGTTSKRLHVPGEDRFFGKGIGTCAVCDGHFYKGKDVAVIGGGNSALEEALYLAKIVKNVYIIHRRNEFRADAIVQNHVKEKENIHFVLDSVVESFSGSDTLEKITLKNVKTQAISELVVDGVFLYVGLLPQTSFVPQQYLGEHNFIKIDSQGRVNNTGLFAAGDCCEGAIKQVVIACGKGAESSYAIEAYLRNNDK